MKMKITKQCKEKTCEGCSKLFYDYDRYAHKSIYRCMKKDKTIFKSSQEETELTPQDFD